MTSSAGSARPLRPEHAAADERSANRGGTDVGTVGDLRVGDAVEVLGLVAGLEHQAFARLADDSRQAPCLEQSLVLSRLSARCIERRDRVLARIEELGGDGPAALARFDVVLADFDARTPSSTWAERLLKAYVGYGVTDDFCRLAARGLDEESARLVADVLGDVSRSEVAVRELDRACAGDEVLSSRLALWGRRLVGEALGVVQRVAQRPEVARVLDRAGLAAATPHDAPAGNATPQAAPGVFTELTAEHTRRMSRLHLTA
ncbi:ferritin-like fold-containing protein [Cellulomonas xiejunii]|uniref:Ferritin-like domain-containing protein n=1 Tax=Cellulomonas xiejunii TaxID=2968083 RepID=A0ABY5KJG7_9CELL|nr:ferritin-like fold-containing protein [Cellulomonas xiejunii]MCC2320321.1 ferritin-like domain-containing protein [Cellulomonas xiejunii]UUI70624.1 ferritin-like domain-containing protein [Cellulomonas xiejunii]